MPKSQCCCASQQRLDASSSEKVEECYSSKSWLPPALYAEAMMQNHLDRGVKSRLSTNGYPEVMNPMPQVQKSEMEVEILQKYPKRQGLNSVDHKIIGWPIDTDLQRNLAVIALVIAIRTAGRLLTEWRIQILECNPRPGHSLATWRTLISHPNTNRW